MLAFRKMEKVTVLVGCIVVFCALLMAQANFEIVLSKDKTAMTVFLLFILSFIVLLVNAIRKRSFKYIAVGCLALFIAGVMQIGLYGVLEQYRGDYAEYRERKLVEQGDPEACVNAAKRIMQLPLPDKSKIKSLLLNCVDDEYAAGFANYVLYKLHFDLTTLDDAASYLSKSIEHGFYEAVIEGDRLMGLPHIPDFMKEPIGKALTSCAGVSMYEKYLSVDTHRIVRAEELLGNYQN